MTGEKVGAMKPSDIKPLRPGDIAEDKLKNLPEQVLQSFNELIAENYRDRDAVVRQDAVVTRMIDKGLLKQDIYDKGWLDVEGIYRLAGWRVRYDKPVYYGGEDFEPFYTFSKSKQKPRL